jgi:hypothetical protein
MAQLTEWLKLMLAEISRKQEESARGAAEEAARDKPVPSQQDSTQKTAEARA